MWVTTVHVIVTRTLDGFHSIPFIYRLVTYVSAASEVTDLHAFPWAARDVTASGPWRHRDVTVTSPWRHRDPEQTWLVEARLAEEEVSVVA